MSEKTKQNQTRLFDYPEVNKQRSKFNLDFKNKMSCNLGKIYPTLCKESLPDDDWRIKTDFFTRWLALDAPVFSEYKLRFNNFFIPNIQVWKGWAQFMGNGDTASAEYLLPEGQEFVSKVPYITTKSFARAMVHSMLVPQTVGVGGNNVPNLAPQTNFRDFVVVGLPFLAWRQTTDFDMWTSIENDVAYPFNTNGTPDLMSVPYWGFFFAPYNDYIKNLEAQGLCYIFSGGDVPLGNLRITDNEEFTNKVWKKWQKTQTAFYYDGFDVSNVSEDMNLLPLPHYVLPLTENIVRLSEQGGSNVWNYGAGYATSVTSEIRHFYGTMVAQRIPVSGQDTYAFSENIAPAGYQHVLIESDEIQGVITIDDSLLASFGQMFVKHYLGSGTLSDYLGNVFTHTLKRQPEISYNYIMGNSPNWTREFVPRGTYDSVSPDIEIGICNDEPISLLPYLCYHKCWTDLMRDPRYELRYIYSDPYKSIFLIPDANGRFVDGDMLVMQWGRYPEFANKNCYSFPQSPSIQMLGDNDINHSNYFTYRSLISLFSLRERRVVHDYYTLMSPNAQYGDAVGASVISKDLVLANQQTDYRTPGNEFMEIMAGGDTMFVKEADGQNPDFPIGSFVGLKGSVSVASLRLAGALQRFMERNNIVGSDYLKQILTHYGVSPRECQHCDTIYLGGDKFSPVVEPVDMVSSNTNTQVTGQQSGQMYVDGHCGDINYKTFEHGYIMQMVTVQNDFNSTQGLQRQRIDKFDFAFPEFANLGAEAVPLSKVVNTDGASGQDSYSKITFGYSPRYADYKCSLDEVHGDFRKSLRYWVSVRQFNPNLIKSTWGLGQKGNLPELGENFLYENPDYNAFAYSGEDSDHCLLDINHFVSVTRSLPMLPTPSIN